MSSWGQILEELRNSEGPNGRPDFDGVRRKYLTGLHRLTGRSTILYVTNCTSNYQVTGSITSITESDVTGFMEVVHDLEPGPLDLILHSPGGDLDATGSIVSFLRARFNHIRVIVPHFAMSAATMIACAADEIVMCDHSSLGPIDPQLYIPTSLGSSGVAAQDVLEQFRMAQQECQDPANIMAWHPILSQYGPDLLVRCQHAMDLSKELVSLWLEKYMFKGSCDSHQLAEELAEWLSDRANFKSHSRRLDLNTLEDKGMKVSRMENDPVRYYQLMSLYHAFQHAFDLTNAAKIIENHEGRAICHLQPKAEEG